VPGNIVIFRPGAIGDTLLDTPLIRALKTKFPDSKIVYFSRKPAIEILKYNRRVIPAEFSFKDVISIRKKFHPEIFMDLKGNLASALASKLSGAKFIFAIDKKRKIRHYNVPIYPPFGKIHYTVYHRLEFGRPLGIDPMNVPIETEFPIPVPFVERMKEKLQDAGDFFIVSHIRLDLPHRSWGAGKYCTFFNLVEKRLKLPVLLINDSPGTLSQIFECARWVKPAPPTPTLHDLGALMKLAGVFFGSDSGPKHIAVSQGTPTFALFFTELPEAWTPPYPHHSYAYKGLPCQPCWKKKCPLGTFDCIHSLTAEEVFEKFEKFLSELDGN